MARNQQRYAISGMTRDLSASRMDGKYAYEIRNMRLTAQEDGALLSLVNEKGNRQYGLVDVTNMVDGEGQPVSCLMGEDESIVGYCVLNKRLVLFTHGGHDAIYRLQLLEGQDNVMTSLRLYSGDLGFEEGMDLETLGVYETETIQKVYWLDGVHQPRFVNIEADEDTRLLWKRQRTPFDFIPKYGSGESVSIERNGYGGAFPAGTVQYAFSYYNLNGQQTNIFHVSPVYYTSHGGRGAAADETVSNSFTLTLDNLDGTFDYLRVYRMVRTTANDNANCRILQDIPIRKEGVSDTGKVPPVTITDTGIYGTNVDPFEILYAGGRDIIPQVMAQKDNTLFLGNFKEGHGMFPRRLREEVMQKALFQFSYGSPVDKGSTGSIYMYQSQLSGNSHEITTFKGGENYRLGLVFQDDQGSWSDVVYIGDYHNTLYPKDSLTEFQPVKGRLTLPREVVDEVLGDKGGYRKVKGVVVYPTYADREVVCQGVLSPTVYNVYNRSHNAPYAQSSWFFRDIHADGHKDNLLQNRHNYNISTFADKVADGDDEYAYHTDMGVWGDSEIYGASDHDVSAMSILSTTNRCDMFVDWNVVSFHTPDLELNVDTVFPSTGLKMRIIGAIPLTSCSNDISVLCDTPPVDSSVTNFKRETFSRSNVSNEGNKVRLSDFDWYDKPYTEEEFDSDAGYVRYPLMPWQRATSLTIQTRQADNGSWYSGLKTKVISNIRTSALTLYLDAGRRLDYQISNVGVYNGGNKLLRLDKDFYDKDFLEDMNYYGEADDLLVPSRGYKLWVRDVKDGGKDDDVKEGESLYKTPEDMTTQDGIRMKYKSSPHMAFQLKYTANNKQVVLPSMRIGGTLLGKQVNPGGSPQWSQRDGGSIDSDNPNMEAYFTKYGKRLAAYIDRDDHGQAIDGEWIAANRLVANIDGISSHLGTFPSGFIDGEFLGRYLAEPREGDVILFPSVLSHSTLGPLPYRLVSESTGAVDTASGRAWYLEALGRDAGGDIAGDWYYKDEEDERVYRYRIDMDDASDYVPAIYVETISYREALDVQSRYDDAREIDYIITRDAGNNLIDNAWLEEHDDIEVGGLGGDIPHKVYIQRDFLRDLGIETPIVGQTFLFPYFTTSFNFRHPTPYDSINGNDEEPNEIEDVLNGKQNGGLLSDMLSSGYTEIGKDNFNANLSLCMVWEVDSDECVLVYYYGDSWHYTHNGQDLNGTGYWKYVREAGRRSLYYADDYCVIQQVDGVSYDTGNEVVADAGNLSQQTLDFSSFNSWDRNSDPKDYGYLYVAELYREMDGERRKALFGGRTDTALQGNMWNTAGEAVELVRGREAVISFDQGDTYYQRYDCLKTYPFTSQDPNQVVEILSFMCESRVNIDGRYDANRGQGSNLGVNRQNFNLLNPAYTQDDNFFLSNYLSERMGRNKDFPNSVVWTRTKAFGEDIDSWTSVLQSSVQDLDGDKGPIQAIRNYNDSLITFQDNGIAKILYNERVQVNTSDGVPIEIANSGKVQGKQYISDHIGCGNRRSIQNTSEGLYFMDCCSKDIYLLGDGISSLSKAKGLDGYLYGRDFGRYRTFFDEKASDIYFTDDDSCLVYNERLGEFSGFFSYEGTRHMFNLEDHLVAVKDDRLWHQFAGKYNHFFGDDDLHYRPFHVTLVANQGLGDKTFTDMEILSESWDSEGRNVGRTFDTLSIWNEYQLGVANLRTTNVNKRFYDACLKRKYRVWRAAIPRATYVDPLLDIGGIEGIVGDIEAEREMTDIPSEGHVLKRSLDRIRSPWAYVRLGRQDANDDKTVLHDIAINYYE